MIESRELRPGDVVQLRSGGPLMTVYKLHSDRGEAEVECEWFASVEAAEPCSAYFDPPQLMVITARERN